MTRLIFVVLLLAIHLTGCPEKTTNQPVAAEKPMTVTTSDQAREAIKNNKTITLVGTALNAKLGGIIQTPMMSVYCVDRHWPDAIEGEMIKVTGKLRVSEDYVAKQDENGAWSQGMAPGSSITIIEPCEYHLMTTD
jgi:hypothetical protein